MGPFLHPVHSALFDVVSDRFFTLTDKLRDAVTVCVTVLDLALNTSLNVVIGSASISGLATVVTDVPVPRPAATIMSNLFLFSHAIHAVEHLANPVHECVPSGPWLRDAATPVNAATGTGGLGGTQPLQRPRGASCVGGWQVASLLG